MKIEKTRFIRWQGILREHLTFMNNMILVSSIGVVASLVALLATKEFSPLGVEKVFFTGGLTLVLVAIFFGMCVGSSRLQDFRQTLKKIRSVQQVGDAGFYGRRTWTLFYIQFGCFFGGAILLTVAFAMIYSSKLF